MAGATDTDKRSSTDHVPISLPSCGVKGPRRERSQPSLGVEGSNPFALLQSDSFKLSPARFARKKPSIGGLFGTRVEGAKLERCGKSLSERAFLSAGWGLGAFTLKMFSKQKQWPTRAGSRRSWWVRLGGGGNWRPRRALSAPRWPPEAASRRWPVLSRLEQLDRGAAARLRARRQQAGAERRLGRGAARRSNSASCSELGFDLALTGFDDDRARRADGARAPPG